MTGKTKDKPGQQRRRDQWQGYFAGIERSLGAAVLRKITGNSVLLESLAKRIRHPGSRLAEQSQRLDDMENRMRQAIQYRRDPAGGRHLPGPPVG